MSKRSRSKHTSTKDSSPTKTVTPTVVKAETRDGFANFVSRVGVGPTMDNQLSQSSYEFNMITKNTVLLESMYRGSWIVGAVIDAVAEDMTRAGIDITTSDGAEDVENLQAGMKRLRIWDSLCDVIKWARLYGGSIGVIMIDGQDLSSPLRIESVGKGQFTGVVAFDRWQVRPDLSEVISNGPDLGLPAYYEIIGATLANPLKENNMTGVRVHHSRVVRQIGEKLPSRQAMVEEMWGSSVIERLNDRLVSFDNATLSSANLINQANLRTIKVDGLREILSQGGKAEENLVTQFQYMGLLQSNNGITLLDKLDEFSSTAYSFAGLSDMMLQFGQQLSGASNIPLVRLFGQSPAGLNSTGESDFRNYYDSINTKQESRLRPAVDKLVRISHQSLFGRPCPNDMQFTFTSLWQMSGEQKANVARTKAETVTGAFEAGAFGKSTLLKELRKSSHDTGVFSSITDEMIEEAEQDDEVPMPTLPEVEEKPEQQEEKKPQQNFDSMFKRAMNMMKGK